MTLHPQSLPPIPEETARVARAAFPKGSLYMRLRDTVGVFFTDEDFAALYPRCGRLAESPWRLALITVMQFVATLSDRQAADAVRGRIDWKYALSLELTDAGFDHSVLSEFRDRLIAGKAEHQLLDLMLRRFQHVGLLKARGQQRSDSTHVIAVVRAMTRVEFLGETLRYALNTLAEIAPTWVQAIVPREWYDRYSQRLEDTRLPKKPEDRDALAAQIGGDGFYFAKYLIVGFIISTSLGEGNGVIYHKRCIRSSRTPSLTTKASRLEKFIANPAANGLAFPLLFWGQFYSARRTTPVVWILVITAKRRAFRVVPVRAFEDS